MRTKETRKELVDAAMRKADRLQRQFLSDGAVLYTSESPSIQECAGKSLDVQVDSQGRVAAVFFGTILLPFKQFKVTNDTFDNMRVEYSRGEASPIVAVAVKLTDKLKQKLAGVQRWIGGVS